MKKFGDINAQESLKVEHVGGLTEALAAKADAGRGVPSGAITIWAGKAPPDGWDVWDGAPSLKALLPKGVTCIRKS